jgi:hypothetical protein
MSLSAVNLVEVLANRLTVVNTRAVRDTITIRRLLVANPNNVRITDMLTKEAAFFVHILTPLFQMVSGR